MFSGAAGWTSRRRTNAGQAAALRGELSRLLPERRRARGSQPPVTAPVGAERVVDVAAGDVGERAQRVAAARRRRRALDGLAPGHADRRRRAPRRCTFSQKSVGPQALVVAIAAGAGSKPGQGASTVSENAPVCLPGVRLAAEGEVVRAPVRVRECERGARAIVEGHIAGAAAAPDLARPGRAVDLPAQRLRAGHRDGVALRGGRRRRAAARASRGPRAGCGEATRAARYTRRGELVAPRSCASSRRGS